ncbi:MAG: hypothetical protein ABI333_01860, partial [bacterium]
MKVRSPMLSAVLAAVLAALIWGGCSGGGEQRATSGRDLPPADPVPLTGAPGSAHTPFPITVFPHTHDGDTAVLGASEIDRYDCAPAISEAGPEVHYEVWASRPGVLQARVTNGPGVDTDLHLLTDPGLRCLARADRELSLGVDAGVYRLIVDTHDRPGPYRLDVALDPPAPELLGSLWNTYYYLANEADHDTPADTPLLSSGCDILTDVPQAFHDDLCIEGS